MSQETQRNARVHAIVEGRVQGVNFRYHTVRTARQLGITGWVANRRDGKVEAVAEGPKGKLTELVSFLHEGSPAAQVTDVEIDWKSATGEFEEFQVRFI
jgi:acylphosphatase